MPSIKYVGKSDTGVFEVFHLLADGDRPVMDVLVDVADQIWVGGSGSFVALPHTIPQITKGKIHRHPQDEADEILANAFDVPATDICMDALIAYVLPRVVTLMARVYCPAKSWEEV